MEEEDVEVLSIYDTSDSGEDFTCEESEDGDDSLSRSDSDENSHGNDVARPAACEQKSQNVDEVHRCSIAY
ncbi:hypothetical protein Hanom_Chr12g01092501 [Helianthus anomalus]